MNSKMYTLCVYLAVLHFTTVFLLPKFSPTKIFTTKYISIPNFHHRADFTIEFKFHHQYFFIKPPYSTPCCPAVHQMLLSSDPALTSDIIIHSPGQKYLNGYFYRQNWLFFLQFMVQYSYILYFREGFNNYREGLVIQVVKLKFVVKFQKVKLFGGKIQQVK